MIKILPIQSGVRLIACSSQNKPSTSVLNRFGRLATSPSRLLPNPSLKLFLSCLMLISNLQLYSQTITPTQTDNITNDNGNNQADPGETIRYKLDISNSGSDANGVQLNAVPDAKTTLVPGSFRSSPLAMPDSYACTGNVGITVPAGSGLLVNDFDDDIAGLTITAAAGATTEGGAFAIASDGSFSYQPPAGFTGTDEFTYTLEDGNELPDCPPTDEGTVTITVSNLIWFVDNTGGGSGGDGRLNTPFKTLADFNANSTPVGDVTYIEHTGTDYTGGIVLQNNERLFGKGHSGGANLADVLGFSLAPFSNMLPAINGSRPLVTNTGTGDGIQLASNNTVRGLNVGNCADFSIDDNGAVGSLTISEVDISNSTGGGFRTDNGGTLAVTLDGVSSTGGVNGVDLNNCSGSFTVSGTISITNSTNTAANISNNSATINFNALNITNTTSNQTGLFASGGTVNSTSGAINTGSGQSIDMDNVALGMNLTSVSCNGCTTGIDLNTTTGNFTISGNGGMARDASGGTIQNTSSHAISLDNVESFSATSLDIISPGDAAGEDGLSATNIIGSHLLRACRFSGLNFSGNLVQVRNTDLNLTLFEVNDCLFTGDDNGNDAILFDMKGNSIAEINVLNNTHFNGLPSDGLQVLADDDSNITANVMNCRFSNDRNGSLASNRLSLRAGDGSLPQTGGGTLTATVSGCTINDTGVQTGGGIPVGLVGVLDIQGDQFANVDVSILNTTIQNIDRDAGIRCIADDNTQSFRIFMDDIILNNIIETGIHIDVRNDANTADIILQNSMIGVSSPVGTACSQCFGGNAIDISGRENTNSLDILLQNNTIRSNGNSGSSSGFDATIEIDVEENASVSLTMLDNVITNQAGGQTFNIEAEDVNATVCLDVNADNIAANANTFSGGVAELEIDDMSANFSIEGLGSPGNAAAVNSFLSARNTFNNGLTIIDDGVNFQPSVGCTIPN